MKSAWRAGKWLFVLSFFGCVMFPGTMAKAKNGGDSPYVKRELRAVWIATVANIDWPSKPGLPIQQQKAEYTGMLDKAKAMGMNAVVVQIKPTADSFYPSNYGPWSKYLTGVQGKDPGYDPLAFMVEEAHKRNLEFHAWFNPYRITLEKGLTIDNLSADHPARKHRDWVVSYGGQLYYNPGIPEAEDFIIDGVMEVVKRYDIDAVHMDDYFYPYRVAGEDFPDQETYEKYGMGKFANKDDWRRDNVNHLIKTLSAKIKQEKNYVKFGISPFGVWRNQAVDPTGSDTTAGQTNYDDLFADTRTWIQQGWIDYITPQIYWAFGFKPAAYEKLIDWWTKEVDGRNIHLYIGQADYKIANNSDPAWNNPDELPNQLKYNRLFPQIQGSMHFSFKDLDRNPLSIKDRLANDVYPYPALVPTMPWLDDAPPKRPTLMKAKRSDEGVKLLWKDQNKSDAAYYVIYRFEGEDFNFTNPKHIIATVRKNGDSKQSYVDTTEEPGKRYMYAITAVDRLHNESKPSRLAFVKSAP